MKRLLIEGPTVEPVTLTEAKAHMRIDASDEDDLIGALVVAARVATEAEIRRVMIEQTWRAIVETWPADGVELPVQPALSVEAVNAIDADGVATLLDTDDYALDPADGSVELVNPAAGAESYEIDFKAGYGDAGENVPQPLRQAILMLATHWHEHRSAVGDGTSSARMPLAYRELIAPYRRMALC